MFGTGVRTGTRVDGQMDKRTDGRTGLTSVKDEARKRNLHKVGFVAHKRFAVVQQHCYTIDLSLKTKIK